MKSEKEEIKSIQTLVVTGGIFHLHQGLQALSSRIEFHLTNIIIAFRRKKGLIASKKVRKVRRVVENSAWFLRFPAHFQWRQVHVLFPINFVAFWQKDRTQEWLYDSPALGYVLNCIVRIKTFPCLLLTIRIGQNAAWIVVRQHRAEARLVFE